MKQIGSYVKKESEQRPGRIAGRGLAPQEAGKADNLYTSYELLSIVPWESGPTRAVCGFTQIHMLRMLFTLV